MAKYKLYCFDGVGKLWVADWIEAASDEEAVRAAHETDVGVKCEVWEGNRFVATIDRRSPVSSAA